MSASAPIPDRGKSSVGGKWQVFRTVRARNTAVGMAGIAGCFLVGTLIHQLMIQKLPQPKVEGVGTKEISQVTPPPQTPPVDNPAPAAAAAPAAAPPPIVNNGAKKDDIVAGSTDYVRMPTSSNEVSFDVPAPQPAAGGGGKAGADKAGEQAKTTTVDFKPTTIEGAKAGPAIDMTYVMAPQIIQCALDTALDSTVAGAIECHTIHEVYSPMHVLLMPAHTAIMGTYRNDIQPGQNRLFGLTASAITPEGIPVPLNSAIADGLGRAGIGATDIDHHYGERFGAALALTGLQSGIDILQTELSKAGQTSLNIGGNSNGGIGSIGSQILQNQIGIKDTLGVRPGTIVSIVVDHPISFADALRVRTAQ